MNKVESDRIQVRTKSKGLSLEQRLEPKIAEAEYLLILVLAFMLWTAGFVDLFSHTSKDSAVLGLYSIPYFAAILVYCLGFLFWSALIFPANSLTWFKNGIHFFQSKPLAGLALFALFGLLLSSMFAWERWVSFPLLEAATAVLIFLFSAVILLARPVPETKVQPWRKVFILLVSAVLLIEAILQGLSFLQLLPIQNRNGLFTHSGRIYQNSEGYTNTTTNKRGWYYPEFRLTDGSRPILITGDSFVLGLQVSKEENMGVVLEGLLASNGDLQAVAQSEAGSERSGETEVIALGLPGYGPGLYLDVALSEYTIQPLQPGEVIVFFHLVNDIQTLEAPSNQIPRYHLGDDGSVKIDKADFALRHDLEHLIIRGYEPVNPVRTVSSHLFLFSFLGNRYQSIFKDLPHVPTPALNMESAEESQPFGASSFAFEAQGSPRADEALKIATGLLGDFKRHLDAQGITMRLVTIPYFPASFYAQSEGNNWDSRLAGYDLFLPETALGVFARQNGIPFLPMGQYLMDSDLSVEEIQALYYQDGTGHLTPEGHRQFAEAVYSCFYSGQPACLTE